MVYIISSKISWPQNYFEFNTYVVNKSQCQKTALTLSSKYYCQALKTTGRMVVIVSRKIDQRGNNNYEVHHALSNRLKSQHK